MRLAILGSTGSIGTQALDVVARNPQRFTIEVLTAGKNADLLIEQALRFVPPHVVIADETRYTYVRDALARLPIEVHAGDEVIAHLAGLPGVDTVLTAMVGFAGLRSTLAAVQAGKTIALANKETLVAAGELITRLAADSGSVIIPVDSEHSAIFQCLAGEDPGRIEKIILTASGGPFRGKSLEELHHVMAADALKHPNWCMGNKITIDSASLMNKGLEVIEARWLFNCNADHIEVVVHPQSIVHSLVQFVDGSIKAQLGLPDMRLPIQYALAWPERLASDFPRFSFAGCSSLTFEHPDTGVFRNLALAYDALRRGGNIACAMNAANEVAVEAFLCGHTRFTQMPPVVEKTMEAIPFVANPAIGDLGETDAEARRLATKFLLPR